MTYPDVSGLPVNLDTTYADDGADASVKLHQQHHDLVHAAVKAGEPPAGALVVYATEDQAVADANPEFVWLVLAPAGVADTTAPTAPVLTATDGDTQSVLTWTAATDAVGVTSYRVYKDAALLATLGNVLTYTATGLTNGTPYAFTVTARDAAGNESVPSNTDTVTPAAAGGGGGVNDTFARTSATTLGTADSGQAWSVLTAGAVYGTDGDNAYQVSGTDQSIATIDSGLADCTITATASTGGPFDVGLSFRATDANNHFLLAFNQGILYRRVAGSFDNIGALASPVSNGDTIVITLNGSTITMQRNADAVVTVTGQTHNQTATLHGLRSNSLGSDIVTSFSVTA